jgi:hypothetical protein
MIVAGCDLRYVAMFPIGAFILMIALIAYFMGRAAAWKWKCPYCKYSPYGNG